MSNEVVDLYLFATDRGSQSEVQQRSGQNSLVDFGRLVAGLPQQQVGSQVQWSVQGQGTPAGKRFIKVEAAASVTLECQRCLQPFVLPVQVENRLEVVRSPSELDGDEDDETERIVGSPRFDLLELIEDELILSLPSVPKHEVCPSAPGFSGGSGEPVAEVVRPSPFAVLERLKKD
ncbi:MAG TPA: YceD family protein [Pusillimonas sp.]|uniref:YceD family protein n=1 Tax=Pusillimonas sp. TaxID=3040095 RepID=UPI002C4DFEDE|nr:YceD family protein [Pusillimonas sp.]HUH87871.1 YceD family protein [Pusillimonas sp.]